MEINEVWLIYSPGSDVLVPSDQFAKRLEDAGIIKVTKLEIKQTLAKLFSATPITLEIAKAIHNKLHDENFIVTGFEQIGNTVRFRLF